VKYLVTATVKCCK